MVGIEVCETEDFDEAMWPVKGKGSDRVGGPLRGPWVRVAGQDADPSASETASFGRAYIKLFYYFFHSFLFLFFF